MPILVLKVVEFVTSSTVKTYPTFPSGYTLFWLPETGPTLTVIVVPVTLVTVTGVLYAGSVVLG